MRRLVSLMVIGVLGLVAVGVVATGCSEDGVAQPDCTTDEDCPGDEICDEAVGVCELPRSNGGGDNQTNDSDQNDQTNNDQTNDDQTNNDTNDGNNVSPPTNDDNGEDDNDVSPPTNGDDNDDENDDETNGEDNDGCDEAFDSCDPADEDHPDYWCVETDEGEDGICLPKCDEDFSAASCPEESYCRELEDVDGLGCVPSACAEHGDCDGGTCIHYDNAYGVCIEDGSSLEGDSCSGGVGGQCGEGLVCDGPDDGIGTCRSVCDPWEGDGCSGFGEVCNLSWTRTGVCTDETTLTDNGVYGTCSYSGEWCSDATQCLTVGDQDFCLKWCRPDQDDCPSVDTTTDGVCNPHISYEVDTIGLCLPACDSDADCGDGEDCVDDLCRAECTDPVVDCCPDDDPDCGAECDADGYCH